MTNTLEVMEFFDHMNYVLSLKFKEKWRHRFSSHFVGIFQDKLLGSFTKQKRLKLSSLYSTYTKRHKYSREVVLEFFSCIEIHDLYPLVYEDDKYLEFIKRGNPS